MKFSGKGLWEIVTFFKYFSILMVLQLVYSLVETIRHWIVDGYTQHTSEHMFVLALCIIFFLTVRQGVYEIFYNVWAKWKGYEL